MREEITHLVYSASLEFLLENKFPKYPVTFTEPNRSLGNLFLFYKHWKHLKPIGKSGILARNVSRKESDSIFFIVFNIFVSVTISFQP